MVELYPYQEKVLELLKTYKKVLIVWAPGLGKTYTSAYIACNLEEIGLEPGNVLIVVPARVLMETWKRYLVKHSCIKKGIRVYLLTYQYIARYYDRLKDLHFRLIIADEAHHLPASKFRKVIKLRYDRLLMITATPYRETPETKRWIFAFADKVYKIEWRAEYYPEVDVEVVVTSDKDETVKRIVQEYPKPILIYTELVNDCLNLARILGTTCIFGGISSDREKVLKLFEQAKYENLYGEPGVLVMTRVGEQGISFEKLKTIIEYGWLGRSWRQILQRLGRLLHTYGGRYVIVARPEEVDIVLDRVEALKKKGYRVSMRFE